MPFKPPPDDLWLPALGGGRLRVAAGAPLQRAVDRLCPGWGGGTSVAPRCAEPAATPAVRIDWTGDGRPAVQAPGGPPHWQSFERSDDAAFMVLNLALRAMLAVDPRRAIVHAAALIAPDGGAVALVGPTHAGKSTLTLLLAAAGWPILGDDVIAVATGDAGAPQAIGLGLAPKLRRPMPPRVAARAGAWADARRAARIGAVDYLHPRSGELAAIDTAAPLRALVRLERDTPAESEGQPRAELRPAGRAEMVRALTDNLFAPDLGGRARLRRMLELAAAARTWTLAFDDSPAAADRLIEAFGCGSERR